MFQFLRDFCDQDFDVAIFGLGFESRSVSALEHFRYKISSVKVLGYHKNTDQFSYQANREIFKQYTDDIIEVCDDELPDTLDKMLFDFSSKPVHILIDITVMSRHRLATTLCKCFEHLKKDSTVSIVYSLSNFIPPPDTVTPVRKVCEINNTLRGSLGDLGRPTSLVIGLGYEKGKALGISHYLDSWRDYLLVPTSPIKEFEDHVLANNHDLIVQTPKERVLSYYVDNPYRTYLDLRSLTLSLKGSSRPILVPLGPKILAAICVLIGLEFTPEIAVWRVSSEYEETPIDRSFSGHQYKFSFRL